MFLCIYIHKCVYIILYNVDFCVILVFWQVYIHVCRESYVSICRSTHTCLCLKHESYTQPLDSAYLSYGGGRRIEWKDFTLMFCLFKHSVKNGNLNLGSISMG